MKPEMTFDECFAGIDKIAYSQDERSGLSLKEFFEMLPEDFKHRLHDEIVKAKDLVLSGNEGNYPSGWYKGKINLERYRKIMAGEPLGTCEWFDSWWVLDDIGWSLKFSLESDNNIYLFIDASVARWMPDEYWQHIEERNRQAEEAERKRLASMRPLYTVGDILKALSGLDPNLPVSIAASYDCGYGYAGGAIDDYKVSEDGVEFLNNEG